MIDFFGGNHTLILAREGSSPVRVSPPDQEQLAAGIKLSELVARGWVS